MPESEKNAHKVEQKHINAILVVTVDDKKTQGIVEYINKEIG